MKREKENMTGHLASHCWKLVFQQLEEHGFIVYARFTMMSERYSGCVPVLLIRCYRTLIPRIPRGYGWMRHPIIPLKKRRQV